jgi:hypothetical protein
MRAHHRSLSSMQTRGRRFLVFAAALLAALIIGARPAKADTLDDVLSLLASVGVIDSAVVEAKPVIECVIGGGNVAECTDAVAHVKAEAKSKLAPNDPRIKQVIDIYLAARAGDWLKVFKLGGSKVACGLVPGGTVKDFFCGPIADQVFAVAGDKIDVIYSAIVKGDWWGLVKLADPSIVCALMPSTVQAVLCNEFMAVVGKAVDLAKNAAAEAEKWVSNLGDVLSGQTKHIPPTDYYLGIRTDILHNIIVERVVYNRSGDNLYEYRVNKVCVDYFDAHTMSKANAQKVCGELGKKLKQEVEAGVDFAKSAVNAYYLGRLESEARAFAAAEYARIDAIRNKIVSLRPLSQQWGFGAMHSTSPALAGLWNACATETYYQHALPSTQGGHAQGPSVYAWICFQAVGEKFSEALVKAKTWLDVTLPADLAKAQAGQCSKSVLGSGAYLLTCDSYQAYRACRDVFAGLGVAENAIFNHCKIDQNKAVARQASRIARALGAKRCRVDPVDASGGTVVCTRPWKRRSCAAMAEDAAAGLPGLYYGKSVMCKYDQPPTRGPGAPHFEQQVANTKAIVGQLNAAIPVRAGAPPPCRALADPLAIRCAAIASAAQANARVSGLALANCPPDPNNDGADAPCYSPLADAQLGAQPLQRQPLQRIQPPPGRRGDN